MKKVSIFTNNLNSKMLKISNYLSKNKGAIAVALIMVSMQTMYGQDDNLSQGLDGISNNFSQSWWPKLKVIGYILAGVIALFGLINVFRQSQRGEENVSKVAGSWATGLAVFLLGIWAIDTFIIPQG